MQWAYGTGLITGSATTGADGVTVYNLNPRGTASRAQMASILMRFCESPKNKRMLRKMKNLLGTIFL